MVVGGAVACDPLGEGEVVGVPEPLGVADGVADRDRDGDGDGDRDGLGLVCVGLGGAVGVALCWPLDRLISAFCAADTGRNRMYSASTATNKPEMTRVEVRGRPLMRHPRWPGRCRGRPRR